MNSIIIILLSLPVLGCLSVISGIKYPLQLIEKHKIDCAKFLQRQNEKNYNALSTKTITFISLLVVAIDLTYFFTYPSLRTGLTYSVFATLCAALIISDARYRLLPELMTLTLILTGFLFALSDYYPATLHSAVCGGLIGLAFVLTTSLPILIILRKQPVAIGDYYFVIGIGIWLGTDKLFQFAIIGVALGFVVALISKTKTIPFGVPLGLSAILCSIIPEPFILFP